MRHSSLARIAALALAPALPLAGCSGDAGSDWEGSVTDSAGVEIVTNTGTGIWSRDAAWTVEQVLVVGAAEGEPEYQFGQISGIDIDSEGRMYVMDQQAREVRVFSPDGQFIANIGKAGSGPGEFSQAAGPIFVGPGDTIAVPDAGQQRISRFSAAGEPIGSYPLPMTEGIPIRWMEAPNQDLIQQAMIMQFPGQEDVEPKNLLLRRSPSGEVSDTVMELPIGRSFNFAGGRPNITLFESEPMWAIGPDGRIFYGTNSDYRLEVFSTDGELQRVIQKAFQRRTVTEGDKEAFRRILQELWERQGVPPQAMTAMSQSLQFAEFYPAYANVLGGPDGSLWVQRIQTPESVSEQGGSFNIQDIGGAEWEVFDDQGRLLGVVRMPPRFTPLAFHGDDIYGLLLDEYDVQFAARMRLDRGADVTGD